MKLFPPTVGLGALAKAQLLHIRPQSKGMLAVYNLEPTDRQTFIDRMGALQGKLNRHYEPVPGIWSTYLVPPNEDVIQLGIGLRTAHGEGLGAAARALKMRHGTLVPDFHVRGLALGYLRWMGV